MIFNVIAILTIVHKFFQRNNSKFALDFFVNCELIIFDLFLCLKIYPIK
jgi:hypothetical protein